MKEISIKKVSDWIAFGIYTLEVLFATCCLSYALVLIARQKKKKVSDILVMHLCGCELTTVIYGYCKDCLHYWKNIDNNDNTIHMLLYVVLYTSVYQSVLIIVLDRVLAVHMVLKYKAFVTKQKLAIVLSITWAVSLATGVIIYFTDWKVWLFWDFTMMIIIVSSYLYIIISVYRRKRAMARHTLQSGTSQLKYQIPLSITCSFVLTVLLPDLVVALNPELYCIWLDVIWSLNWISDPLVYVIFTKLQHRKDEKHKQAAGQTNSVQALSSSRKLDENESE